MRTYNIVMKFNQRMRKASCLNKVQSINQTPKHASWSLKDLIQVPAIKLRTPIIISKTKTTRGSSSVNVTL